MWLSETGVGTAIHVDVGPAVLIPSLTAQVAVVLVVGGGAGRKEGDIDNSVN